VGNIACTGDALQVFQLLQTYTLLTGYLISNADVTGQTAAKMSDRIKITCLIAVFSIFIMPVLFG